jgi:hypothetical protein
LELLILVAVAVVVGLSAVADQVAELQAVAE